MRVYFFILLFTSIICSEESIINKEKQFLSGKSGVPKEELIEFFGSPDDSLSKNKEQLLIWDNLFGKMTMHSAPPYTPLDSANFFGKRILHVVIDSNGNLKEYDYWDYTNPQDFIDRGFKIEK
ncbi:hypothetical protein OAQ99_07845 [Candidatus Kapabacteria bacterium]|nr:hypothetical protein [Candidatus Kapabacteria bacterium]